MGIAAEEATPVRGVRHVLWGHPEIPVDGPRMGSPDAPVAVVMWGDYTCPGCARFAQETLPTLVAEYVAPGRVQFEFRNYSFRGPASVRAAEAAACAADQDRFWDLHLTLFANQNGRADQAFSHEQLRSLAAAIGLDLEQYEWCMASGLSAAWVEASSAIASDSTQFPRSLSTVSPPHGTTGRC
jgi:protein-disulfide isomerase